jgi:hypothetical protein
VLRKVLVVIGVLLLITAAVFLALGLYPFLPHLLVLGLMLSAGIVWERWQYKPAQAGAPDPHWQATGERFVDPQSGETLEVWFDPRDGESHYVKAQRQ